MSNKPLGKLADLRQEKGDLMDEMFIILDVIAKQHPEIFVVSNKLTSDIDFIRLRMKKDYGIICQLDIQEIEEYFTNIREVLVKIEEANNMVINISNKKMFKTLDYLPETFEDFRKKLTQSVMSFESRRSADDIETERVMTQLQLEEAISRTFFNHDEDVLDSSSFYEYADEDDITLEEILRDVDLNITFGDFVEACVKGTKNQLSSLLNIIFSPKKP